MFPKTFTIYDTTDSRNVIKACIKELQLDDKIYKPNEVHSRIWCDPDDLRNLGLSPEDNVKLLGASEEQETGILRTSLMQCLLPFVYENRSFTVKDFSGNVIFEKTF